MNPINSLFLRWRTPRALALAGLMALIVVVAALALTQTSTVAAPPPPLRGPFRFVEATDKMSAAEASTALLPWTPFYTQTFDASLTGWTMARSTAIYTTPAPHKWGRVQYNYYPGENFTNTLWAAMDPYPELPVDWTVYANSAYTKTMDTWAVYGPLDTQRYAHFRVEFDFYLDADPGAYFGWAASNDGQTFCGKLGSSTTGSRIQKWQHMTVDLTGCSEGAGTPVYLAFLFQSDGSTPAGLGAFVDNVVISGLPWTKVYLPLVRRDPTPTPSPTPTVQPYPVTQSYDFEPGTGSTSRWCKADYTEWASNIISLGGSNAYYLAAKQSSYLWALSPRDSSADNFRITANFNLLRMNNSLSLSNYGGNQFGLLFTVKGNPFDPNDPCAYNGGSAGSGIGFYRFIIKVKNDGSGYKTRLTRWENGVEPDKSGDFVDLPAGVTINRTGWNTMRIDRDGANIKAYINDTLVQNWDNSTGGTGGWFGIFTETTGNNPSPYFESDWDNITIYKLR